MNTKIVDKIKKLLKLSKSDNEHEAANAAATAASMMLEHQISVQNLEDNEDDAPIDNTLGAFVIDGSNHNKVIWKSDLAFGVAASFGCKSYWSGSTSMLVGRKGDVDAVRYIYQYLVREVNKLAEKSWKAYYLNEHETARAYKGAFRTGATLVIRRRLRASRQENIEHARAHAKDEQTHNAIVQVSNMDNEISKFYAQMAQGFGTYSPKYGAKSIAGLNAGREAGANVNLGNNKGISGGSRGLRAPAKLLGKG